MILRLGLALMGMLWVMRSCGAQRILYLWGKHWICFKYGLDIHTNNFWDLSALPLLLWMAIQKGTNHLHIYGDSHLILCIDKVIQ